MSQTVNGVKFKDGGQVLESDRNATRPTPYTRFENS